MAAVAVLLVVEPDTTAILRLRTPPVGLWPRTWYRNAAINALAWSIVKVPDVLANVNTLSFPDVLGVFVKLLPPKANA